MGNWIQTVTNKRFYPLDPLPEEVCVEDIAHSLSMKCRFSGHTRKYYSVAQHSVYVSLVCDPADALWGLLHDGSEAYLVDMPKPLKVLPEFQWFVDVEKKVQETVCQKFLLPLEQPESVHRADRELLMTEKRDLMAYIDQSEWQVKYTEQPIAWLQITSWSPSRAKREFLRRYKQLTSPSSR